MDLKKGHLGVLKGLTPREALNLIQHKPHPEHCTAPIEWRATLVPLADHKWSMVLVLGGLDGVYRGW